MKLVYNFLSFLFIVLLLQSKPSWGQDVQYLTSISQSLKTPVRIAFDKRNQTYVTDTKNKVISKYDALGNFIGTLSISGSPISLAIDVMNRVYVGDETTGHILRINDDGSSSLIYSETQFPSDMLFGPDGLLYIVDSKLKQVIVIDNAGTLIRTIGADKLLHPAGIAYNSKNNQLLISEHGGVENEYGVIQERVWMYDLMGNLINSFGFNGNSNGGFYRIQGLAVDRCGNIFIPDPFQGRVSVFDQNGVYISNFGIWGGHPGELNVPLDIAINSNDSVWMTSMNNSAIELYKVKFLMPTSNILSDNIKLCKGDSIGLPIHLTGTAPWSFTYTINGANPVTVNNVLQSPYYLNAKASGIYQVSALSDSSKTGTCFTGTPEIVVDTVIPSSTLTGGNQTICSGSSALLPIYFTGTAPWSFTFAIDSVNQPLINNITSSPFNLSVQKAGKYEIVDFSGVGCKGNSITGSSTITVLPSANNSIAASICKGSSYILGSQTVSSTGTYTEKYPATNGCDSTVTLNLTVLPEKTASATVSICGNSTYTFGSQVLTSPGNYTERFTTSSGCDSVVALTLLVNNPVSTESNASICEGTSYVFGNQTLTTSGTYSETFTSVSGCDSTVLLTLEVNSLPTAMITSGNQTVCVGSSATIAVDFTGTAPWNFAYSVDNSSPATILYVLDNPYLMPVNQAGTYSLYNVSGVGCNGTVSPTTAVITVSSGFTSNEAVDICANTNYVFGSQLLTNSGVYTETFTSVGGCDSTVTLNLGVHPLSNETTTASVCQGNSFYFGSQNLVTSGVYSETFSSMYGCDSVVTLTLDVLPESSGNSNAVICNNASYTFGTQNLTATGTYVEPFVAANGCDSVVTLNLSVIAMPVPQFSYVTNGLTVSFANSSTNADSYVWSFGDGNTSSASDPVYTYTGIGIYVVDLVAYNSACGSVTKIDTVDLVTIPVRNLSENSGIRIYPNPSNGQITVDFGNYFQSEISLEIYSVTGQKVYAAVLESKIKKQQIDLSSFANGIYTLKLTAFDFVNINKLILSR